MLSRVAALFSFLPCFVFYTAVSRRDGFPQSRARLRSTLCASRANALPSPAPPSAPGVGVPFAGGEIVHVRPPPLSCGGRARVFFHAVSAASQVRRGFAPVRPRAGVRPAFPAPLSGAFQNACPCFLFCWSNYLFADPFGGCFLDLPPVVAAVAPDVASDRPGGSCCSLAGVARAAVSFSSKFNYGYDSPRQRKPGHLASPSANGRLPKNPEPF